jgi:GNAT superfamily N-acetyltransferase
MSADSFQVRIMRPQDLELALDWAAAEGWNPGLEDAACFATVDPQGFLLGEIAGVPAATLWVANYDERFAFLGGYIVRPDLRGRGYGWRLWQAGIAHAGARTIGLDGVVAQQENYKRSGFVLAYRNVRYGGRLTAAPSSKTMPLASIPLQEIAQEDAGVFPADRQSFLRAWLNAPGHVAARSSATAGSPPGA